MKVQTMYTLHTLGSSPKRSFTTAIIESDFASTLSNFEHKDKINDDKIYCMC